MTESSSHATTLIPDPAHHRKLWVIVGQWEVCLEEQHATAPTTHIVLNREQLLAFLVALPADSLQAALRVQATGDPQPFHHQEDEG